MYNKKYKKITHTKIEVVIKKRKIEELEIELMSNQIKRYNMYRDPLISGIV